MSDSTARIAQDPRFIELASRRNRLSLTLFLITMVIYVGLMLTATVAPQVLATPLWPGAATTVGWPVGALAIIVTWLLTVYYVRRANADAREMEKIVEQVLAA